MAKTRNFRGSSFPRIAKSFIFTLTCIIFTILNIIFLPVVGILFLPIYFHRYAASKLAQIFRPDLRKMLAARSTNFTCDLLHTRPACYTIISLTLSGHMSIDLGRQLVSTRALPAKLPNGDLRYPELQQYPYQWMGFKFWKQESDFKIEEHVYGLDQNEDEHLTPQDLQRIRQNLNTKPFAKNKSPWEFLVIHNRISDSKVPSDKDTRQTVVLFKVHHGMADGYSILKLFVEILAENNETTNAMPNYTKRSQAEIFLYWLTFPIRSVYENSCTTLNRLMERTHWDVPPSQRSHSVHAVSNPIPISRVKACKDKHGVTFTSVVYGICALSTKSWMAMENIPVPDWIACALPFPMPGHPPKLRNFMSQGLPRFPFGLHESAVSTLKTTNKVYNGLKTSTAPFWNFFFGKALGGLYAPLCNSLVKSVIPSVLMTNFPAKFEKRLSVNEYEVIDCYYFCGLLDMPGLGFYMLTYVDTLTVVVAADSSLMSESQVQQLADFIETELQNLEDSPAVEVKKDASSVV